MIPRSSAQRWLILALAAIAVCAMPSVVASIEKANPAHPRITDGLLTLDNDQLSATGAAFLSGLRNHTLVTSYESNSGELLNCTDAFVQYSLDGTDPAKSPLRAPLVCDASAPAPAFKQTYRGILPAASLRAALPGAVVRFQIGVLVLPLTTHIDDNHGRSYAYPVDTTAPAISAWTPTASGGDPAWGASKDGRPALGFRVMDDASQSPLAAFGVEVDGADATQRFACVAASPFQRDCRFDYSREARGFEWAEGDHLIIVHAADATGNAIEDDAGRFVLRIDRSLPVIGGVSAQPAQSVAGQSVPTTARGVKVTVRASVQDASLDATSGNAVVAQLVAAAGSLRSAPSPMRYDSETKQWTTSDALVPRDWPSLPLDVSVRVTATDRAGNSAAFESPGPLLRLDPEPPVIVVLDPPDIVGSAGLRVRAAVFDDASGVDPSSVRLRFLSVAGSAAAPGAENYQELAMTRASEGSYEAIAPSGTDGSVMGFYVVARDRAGGESRTDTMLASVDAVAPQVFEVDPQDYRGLGPQTFTAKAADDGSGVDTDRVTLNYGFGGEYHAVAMKLGTDGLYRAVVDLKAKDHQRVTYYLEASDEADNQGRAGQPGAPLSFWVDGKAPSLVIEAPKTSDGGPLRLTWRADDGESGIEDVSIEARTPGGGWFQLRLPADVSTAMLCPSGPSWIEFRGTATDRAGNVLPLSETALASTEITGPGCTQRIVLDSVRIASGKVVNGTGQDPLVLSWKAISAGGAVPDSSLAIDVRFSPDGGAHFFDVRRNVPNNGRLVVAIGELDACSACVFEVRASSLTGADAVGRSSIVSIPGGDPKRDRDGNGLPDAWEIRFGPEPGVLRSDEDPDEDGLTNALEAEIGSNPLLPDTDGDGETDGSEYYAGTGVLAASALSTTSGSAMQWDPVYWFVPPTFAGVFFIYLVGRARRW
jgi:hypothetical protein